MSEGFDKDDINVSISKKEFKKLMKKYKGLKKYQRSSLYELKMMDGTETIITDLLKDGQD